MEALFLRGGALEGSEPIARGCRPHVTVASQDEQCGGATPRIGKRSQRDWKQKFVLPLRLLARYWDRELPTTDSTHGWHVAPVQGIALTGHLGQKQPSDATQENAYTQGVFLFGPVKLRVLQQQKGK